MDPPRAVRADWRPRHRPPIFGRDISFFLFDLPFLRGVQSVFNALVALSLLVAAARYVAGMARAGLHFPTPARVHLAILGGLFLLSVAVGYQLDKYELVYSTRGVATGVSFTDAHAQFAAFDILTVLSAFAAAFLVGAAFTRWNWPLGSHGRGLVRRLDPRRDGLPRGHPALRRQPEHAGPGAPYIANNIAMTRLAFNLGSWDPPTNYGGEAPLTQAQIDADRRPSRTPGCGTTGRSATRSTSSRPSASTTTSPTSTRTATRSTAPNAR